MTNNLGRTEVSAGQSQKEVTINESDGFIDAALTDVLSSDYTAGNVTLTSAEYQHNKVFRATNLTVARSLILPNVKRDVIVDNSAGTAVLTVTRGATTTTVNPGEVVRVYTDGTTDGLRRLEGPEELTHFAPGTVAGSTLLWQKVATRPFRLLDELLGSRGFAVTAPSGGSAVFDVEKNGSVVGTITFASTVQTATFTTTAGTPETFAVGDRVAIRSQATLNGIANVSFNLLGWRT